MDQALLDGLERRWQDAETQGESEAGAGCPVTTIGTLVRCALVRATANSLSASIPPELLAALIRERVWTPHETLAYARQVLFAPERVDAFAALASVATDPIRSIAVHEAFAVVRSMESDAYRDSALTGIAEYLPPNAVPQAFALWRQHPSGESFRALCPRLPEPLLREALAFVRKPDESDSVRAEVLAALASRLPPTLLDEALTLAASIHYAPVTMLSALAPHLRGAALTRAVMTAREFEEPGLRALALAALVPHLRGTARTAAVREALGALQADSSAYWRVEALPELGPFLRGSLTEQALALARSTEGPGGQAHALAVLVPHLPKRRRAAVVREALDRVIEAPDDYPHANQALATLAPFLPRRLLPKALAIIGRMEPDTETAEVLRALAPYVPEALVPEALNQARDLWDGADQADALCGMAEWRAEPQRTELLREAIATAGESEHGPGQLVKAMTPRARSAMQEELLALAEGTAVSEEPGIVALLAPDLSPGLLPRALAVSRAVHDRDDQVSALYALAVPLGRPFMDLALAAADSLRDSLTQAEAIRDLAGHLPAELLPSALRTAEGIRVWHYRVQALAALVPRLADPRRGEALETLVATLGDLPLEWDEEHWITAEAVRAVAPYLSPEMFAPILAQVPYLKEEQAVEVIAALAPHLPELLLPEALNQACSLEREWRRGEAFVALAPHLPEPLLSEALGAAHAIADATSRAKAVAGLSCYLPEGERTAALASALGWVGAVEDSLKRIPALWNLMPHLPEAQRIPVLEEALAATRQLTGPGAQPSSYLVELAKGFPEPQRSSIQGEALGVARRIADADIRVCALEYVVLNLPEPSRPRVAEEVLATLTQTEGTYIGSDLLAKIAPYLTDSLLLEALAMVWETGDWLQRGWGYSELAPCLSRLPRALLFPAWCRALRIAAAGRRSHLLSELPPLIPVIAALGGEEALRQVFHAVEDAAEQWP